MRRWGVDRVQVPRPRHWEPNQSCDIYIRGEGENARESPHGERKKRIINGV